MIPEQHRERLNGCDPVLVEKAGKLINALELRGIEVMVAPDGGLRTVRRQQYLYSLGRTRPGAIVTNCDGVKRKSKHQSGRAADIVFRSKPWDSNHPWDAIGEEAERVGLVWGGTWKMRDLPHVELP